MSKTCNYGWQFASEKCAIKLNASGSWKGLFMYIFKRVEGSGFEIKKKEMKIPPNLHPYKIGSAKCNTHDLFLSCQTHAIEARKRYVTVVMVIFIATYPWIDHVEPEAGNF